YQREGKSKIHPINDTLRFVQIIGRTGMYFAPLRILTPLIVLLALASVASLGYDAFVLQDLTEKSLVLLTMCLNVSIFAILADMIDKRSTISAQTGSSGRATRSTTRRKSGCRTWTPITPGRWTCSAPASRGPPSTRVPASD